MKYTSKISRKDGGISWVFKPPRDAASAGIVKTQTFRDGRTARSEVSKLLDKIDAFRKGELVTGDLGKLSTLSQVVGHYLNTKHFNSLSPNTQKNYQFNLKSITRTEVYGKQLSNFCVDSVSVPVCTEMYDIWEQDVSTNSANEYARVFSMLMNYCVSLTIVNYNPMALVNKRSHETRSVVWTHNQVEKFCDVAFSEFKYRNLGLAVLMAYEWGQRPTDIYNLKWDNIDFELDKVKIRQSKRGATVELPLDPVLSKLLKEQQDDWDFQEYVVPFQRPSDGAYRAFTHSVSSPIIREIKATAGLPDDLWVGDLRKTAINQMIDSDVDHLAIMSVTGHKNVASLNPYVRHNLKAAKSALGRRTKE
tara:strand:- start:531 stop:1619 length:1089 start_codon:yes stop_codon:yes gene_type:complete